MKEIIVIKDSQAIDEWKRTIACYVDIDNSIYKAKFEKVPETWEELKSLCKNLKDIQIIGNVIYLEPEDLARIELYSDGVIVCNEYALAENRTPAQMWNIIKNLIGEQNGNKNKI